jgi:HrpA-like RNA helicase
MTSLRQSPESNPNLSPIDPHFFDALPLQEWPAQWHPTGRFPTPQAMFESDLSPELLQRHSFGSQPSFYRLGDPDLPVAPFREHIVQTVRDHQSSVTDGPTGSGKSSQYGLYLLEAGFSQVYIAQPRIIAARNLFLWTRKNLAKMGAGYEDLVGYVTGNSEDSYMPPGVRLVFGVEQSLYNMACENQLKKDAVIVHDEAHERTAPTVVFMGVMKDLLAENPNMRQVTCSATLNTEQFARYQGRSPNNPVPVITLRGRTYPITDDISPNPPSMASAIAGHMSEGRNVLGFEPGVQRMQETRSDAQRATPTKDDRVHVLYGDQSPLEQAEVLNANNGNHIVATKPAETSITPPNTDAVVDSGLANYGVYRAGKRILRTDFASKATLMQRRGRVGRVKPGFYTLARPNNAPPPPRYEDRADFDPPAIENTSVAALLLPLIAKGSRMEELDLPEYPTSENLQYDYTLLRRLGATALDENGKLTLTGVGKAMNGLPLDVSLSRMLVEAGRQDAPEGIDPDLLQLQAAAAAAIQQVNGILDIRQGNMRRYVKRKSHEEVISNEFRSDVLFALDVFVWLRNKQKEILATGDADAEVQFERLLHRTDILSNRYHKAVRAFEELCRRLELDSDLLEKPDIAHRQQLIACQITGAEELFVRRSKQVHRDIRGEHRTIGRRTTMAHHMAHLVIGSAFDIEGLRETGRFTRKFITGSSIVTVEQLLAHAANRISRRTTGYGVTKHGTLVEIQELYFDDSQQFARQESTLSPTLESRVALMHAMMKGKAPSAKDPEQIVTFRSGTPNAARAISQFRRALDLEQKSGLDLDVEARYLKMIERVIRRTLKEVPLDVIDPVELDKYIPKKIMRDALVHPGLRDQLPEIDRQAPDAIAVQTGDGETRDLPVYYKNGIAYITLPRDLRLTAQRADFKKLEEYKAIKLRVANGKYHAIDAIFDLLDEQRATEAAKQARRAEYRIAVSQRDPTQQTRRERRQDFADQVEEQLKVQAKAILSKRIIKGLPQNIRRQKVRQQADKLRKQQANDKKVGAMTT